MKNAKLIVVLALSVITGAAFTSAALLAQQGAPPPADPLAPYCGPDASGRFPPPPDPCLWQTDAVCHAACLAEHYTNMEGWLRQACDTMRQAEAKYAADLHQAVQEWDACMEEGTPQPYCDSNYTFAVHTAQAKYDEAQAAVDRDLEEQYDSQYQRTLECMLRCCIQPPPPPVEDPPQPPKH